MANSAREIDDDVITDGMLGRQITLNFPERPERGPL